MFQASISASKIQYKKQSSTDSTLEGAQLMWIHKISPVDTFRLMAQTNKTEFESDPSLDYKLETVSASYSVNLNHLSYGLSVGQNKATQDKNNDSFSRPNYNLNVNYVSPLYTAKLTFAQRISNSSAGDGNSEGFIDTSLDSINAGLDLINIKSGGLLFSTSIICERCTLTAALENNREDYKTLNEDSDLRKVSTSFRYIVGRNGALQLSYNELKRTFDTQAERDYLRKEYEISYSHNYIKKVDMKLFARRNFNDSERLYNKYEENIVGLVVSYSL
ncbi:MAG: hypothetical protein EOP48_14650 [Sphingobacteriales bacterium]|nr:MAG: hypothetical protein EOP48_14650 [Sphingobacteriales bacterium]